MAFHATGGLEMKIVRYNLEQKMCRLFHVLAQFLFIKYEAELNYCHQKVNTRVAPQVAERFKTQEKL